MSLTLAVGPLKKRTSACRRLRGFVKPMVLQRLLELMGPKSSIRYATGRDSVDEMVTFEYYPMTNSTWHNEEVGVGDVFDDDVLESWKCIKFI